MNRLLQLSEMTRYREDLDKLKNERYSMKHLPTPEKESKVAKDQHHALINPIPFNIQNPYILKDLKEQSYLANLGNQNISSGHF